MSELRARAEEYLVMRRALGFKLSTQGRLLMSFVGYCDDHAAATLSIETAVAWARSTPRSADPLWWARRLMVVRVFARHLVAFDPATQVPPADVLPHSYRRITPYLYSPDEVTALMRAAGVLVPRLRAATYATVIGLLATTGLRIGEACALDHSDVDLDVGLVTVRNAKFGKSRQVPVHVSTLGALRIYAARRDQLCPTPSSPGFFVSTRGTRLDVHNVPHTFCRLLDAAGIAAPPGVRRPRLHDLRHTFTVATLLDWYRAGVDVQARLPLLSTYLGHVDPKSTYWYLQATPELLSLAVARLQPSGGDQS